ncbi:MAG: DUF2975 domain-containing protein [Prevotella sp.]|nr:DUF2975 domain-containing protein [Prevotella sp.]
MVVDVIVAMVVNANDMAQGFSDGWKDGASGVALTGGEVFAMLLTPVVLGFAIAAIICIVRFILNVNRDEVFTQKNVSLLRWFGIDMIVAMASCMLMNLAANFSAGDEWTNMIEGMIGGIFALIMAEAFCIGIKLQEEQNLTI